MEPVTPAADSMTTTGGRISGTRMERRRGTFMQFPAESSATKNTLYVVFVAKLEPDPTAATAGVDLATPIFPAAVLMPKNASTSALNVPLSPAKYSAKTLAADGTLVKTSGTASQYVIPDSVDENVAPTCPPFTFFMSRDGEDPSNDGATRSHTTPVISAFPVGLFFTSWYDTLTVYFRPWASLSSPA